MSQTPLMESDLVAFDHVAAGHEGVLSDVSGALIIKPCTAAEIAFYESSMAHPDFAAYMPTFMGTLALSSPDIPLIAQVGNIEPEFGAVAIKEPVNGLALPSINGAASEPSRGKRLDTGLSIVLENAAAGFKKPNILDLKLGSRLWADDARPEKRLRLEKVTAETTGGTLGFRIAGMKVWQGTAHTGTNGFGKDGYKMYDKAYGRKLTKGNVENGFRDFLFVEGAGITEALGKKMAKRLWREVEGMKRVLERQESRMYSASILFVYEGDGEALQQAINEEMNAPIPKQGEADDDDDDDDDDNDDEEEDDNEAEEEDEEDTRLKIEAVKLIDFAHAAWTPGQGPDENVIQGIKNVSRILNDLAK
ncbi:MAG: hypothetical protein M1827_002328 [Pycnora praestabilis]|nr:MAG: hypothetical protein M1827_002328 [Pycnora praestabilis]